MRRRFIDPAGSMAGRTHRVKIAAAHASPEMKALLLSLVASLPNPGNGESVHVKVHQDEKGATASITIGGAPVTATSTSTFVPPPRGTFVAPARQPTNKPFSFSR